MISTNAKIGLLIGLIIVLSSLQNRIVIAQEQIGLPDLNQIAPVWSPDGLWIALIDENTVSIFNSISREVMHALVGHEEPVGNIAWSADGLQIATTSADRTVRVWDNETGALINTLDGYREPQTNVIWSVDGKNILSFYPRLDLVLDQEDS
jgi:WD40 repeat protein